MNDFTPSQRAGLENCRDAEQLLVMTRHYMHDTCPFCINRTEHDKAWLLGTHWHFKENDWPMKHTKTHLVIAAASHITELSQVTEWAWAELATILGFVKESYGAINGGLVFRSGPLTHSAGTVEHLHANILYPDLTGPVRITLAKEVGGPEIERRHRRFHGFMDELPVAEYRFLAEHGVGLSSFLVNEIHDPVE